MTEKVRFLIFAVVVTLGLFAGGCVERKLTVVSEPEGAIVWLNDEEVGTTPVTVNFNWYGDYYVRLEKDGYAILNTHRELDRPAHDYFPLDFFAQVLTPKRIVDETIWTFDLQPYKPASHDELVKGATAMQKKADAELGQIANEIISESK
ncbi:MAG: PEGA domain-containing protein [Planctomycetota bacterium]|jgi:hypothetical protein